MSRVLLKTQILKRSIHLDQQTNIRKKSHSNLLEIWRFECAHNDAKVNAYNRNQHGNERNGRQFAYKLDANKHDQADDYQEQRAVYAKVMIGIRRYFYVTYESALGTHVFLSKIKLIDLFAMIENLIRYTYQKYFYRTHYIH